MSENQKEPQYKLRWSEELRNKVVESAKQHSRSINAEICTRLEESFKPEINPTETFEFEEMKRIHLKQSAQIEDLSNMLRELIKKPS